MANAPTVMPSPLRQTIHRHVGIGYDAAGRANNFTLPTGSSAVTYNSGGNVATLGSPTGGSLAFGYNGSLPTSFTWSGAVAGSVGMAYDNSFRLTNLNVNGSNPISFTYDNDDLLTGAGALTLARDPGNGRLTGTTLGSATTTYTYGDSLGSLSQLTAKYSTTTLFDAVYTRDSLERITQLVETIQGSTKTWQYAYDTVGRLNTVHLNGVLVSDYDYDGNGNRVLLTTTGGSVTGVVDDQDRLLSYGTATYKYTANGELTEKIVGTDTTKYTYDVLGSLLQVRLPNAGVVIDYGSSNLLTYAAEDPINYVDADGRQLLWGAAVGGGLDAFAQLAQNGWQLDCVDWWRVGRAAAIGAAFGGVFRVAKVFRGIGSPPTTGPYGPIPRPPGWNENWLWRAGDLTGKSRSGGQWVDEAGGAWRWSEDARHAPHWDYNRWNKWNSQWRNVDPQGNELAPWAHGREWFSVTEGERSVLASSVHVAWFAACEQSRRVSGNGWLSEPAARPRDSLDSPVVATRPRTILDVARLAPARRHWNTRAVFENALTPTRQGSSI